MLVLSYENAIRKNAYKQMVLKGLGFADALVQSWKDAATKERQFTTPHSLCAKRPQPWSWDNSPANLARRAEARASPARARIAPRMASRYVFVLMLRGAVRKGLNVIVFMSARSAAETSDSSVRFNNSQGVHTVNVKLLLLS